MDQSTPQQPSRKKTILSLTVLVVLTGIVFWIFQRHWAEISAALAQLRFWQVLLVLAVGLTYPVLEGLVSWVIIRSRMPGFTVRQALELVGEPLAGRAGPAVRLGPIRRKAAGPVRMGSSICIAAVNLNSGARSFPKAKTLLVQNDHHRFASASPTRGGGIAKQ